MNRSVGVRADQLGHRVAMNLRKVQVQDLFIGFVVKDEALVPVAVGNQGRQGVGNLAQPGFTLSG